MTSSIPARTGKIARLPLPLREELNHRLAQNNPASELLAWLNALPEVKTILAAHFNSAPINAQNISNWRRHGFAAWQTRDSFLSGLRTIAEDAADIASALGSVTEHAARLLALHFTRILCPSETIRDKECQSPGLPETTIKLLCDMSRAIAALRRADHAQARLHQHPHTAPIPPIKPPPLSAEPEIKPNQANSTLRSAPSVPSIQPADLPSPIRLALFPSPSGHFVPPPRPTGTPPAAFCPFHLPSP